MEKIFLVLRAAKLWDVNAVSASDPYAVIVDGNGKAVGHTEVEKDTLNPVFRPFIEVEYSFQVKQSFEVQLFNEGTNDSLGKAAFTLGQLMSARHSTLTLQLNGYPGTVTVTGMQRGS